MIDEVLNYIRQQFLLGARLEDVKKVLINRGWKESDIEDKIKVAQKQILWKTRIVMTILILLYALSLYDLLIGIRYIGFVENISFFKKAITGYGSLLLAIGGVLVANNLRYRQKSAKKILPVFVVVEIIKTIMFELPFFSIIIYIIVLFLDIKEENLFENSHRERLRVSSNVKVLFLALLAVLLLVSNVIFPLIHFIQDEKNKKGLSDMAGGVLLAILFIAAYFTMVMPILPIIVPIIILVFIFKYSKKYFNK